MKEEQETTDYHNLSSQDIDRLNKEPDPIISGELMRQFYNDDAVLKHGKLYLDNLSLIVNGVPIEGDKLFYTFGSDLQKLTPSDEVRLVGGNFDSHHGQARDYFDLQHGREGVVGVLYPELVLKNWLQYNSPQPASLLTVETPNRNREFLDNAKPGSQEFLMITKEQMKQFATDDWIEENAIAVKILKAVVPEMNDKKSKGLKM